MGRFWVTYRENKTIEKLYKLYKPIDLQIHVIKRQNQLEYFDLIGIMCESKNFGNVAKNNV